MTKTSDLDTAALIIQIVCKDYHVKPSDLEGPSRDMWFVWPRWVALWLIRKYTSMSSHVIGELFNRDHSSVLVVINRSIPNETETNPTRKMQLFQTEAKVLNALQKPQRKAA